MSDEEKLMFKKLAQAIDALTEELHQAREERKRELATKQDVARILAAIELSEQDGKALAALLVRAKRISNRAGKLAWRLGRLDDQTVPE